MWRKMTREDIRLGLVVKFDRSEEAFNDCVIVALDDAHGEPTLWLARPYVYANANYSSKQPMLGCEVFGVSIARAVEPGSNMLVSESKRRLDVRAMQANESTTPEGV